MNYRNGILAYFINVRFVIFFKTEKVFEKASKEGTFKSERKKVAQFKSDLISNTFYLFKIQTSSFTS